MLFLPRNTSIKDLVNRLCKHHKILLAKSRLFDLGKFNQSVETSELSIEVEKIMVGQNCKALVVYTGDLVKITSKNVCKAFIDRFCTQKYGSS